MRIDFNGRKVVKVDNYVFCKNCPFDINEPDCLAHLFGIIDGCSATGFRYEDSI